MSELNKRFWETFEETLVKIWSVKVEVLLVTRVGGWISCFKPWIVRIGDNFYLIRQGLWRNCVIIRSNIFVVIIYIYVEITKNIYLFFVYITYFESRV